MAERPAVNTSPLFFLSRAGLLDLLKVSAGQLVVPAAVMQEITDRGPSDPTVEAIGQANWLSVIETPAVAPVIQAWDLGQGESAVLGRARKCRPTHSHRRDGAEGDGHRNGYPCEPT